MCTLIHPNGLSCVRGRVILAEGRVLLPRLLGGFPCFKAIFAPQSAFKVQLHGSPILSVVESLNFYLMFLPILC